jgi:hypothetical protein
MRLSQVFGNDEELVSPDPGRQMTYSANMSALKRTFAAAAIMGGLFSVGCSTLTMSQNEKDTSEAADRVDSCVAAHVRKFIYVDPLIASEGWFVDSSNSPEYDRVSLNAMARVSKSQCLKRITPDRKEVHQKVDGMR